MSHPVSGEQRQAPYQLQDLHSVGQANFFHLGVQETPVMFQRVPPVQKLGQPPAGHASGVMTQPEIVNSIVRKSHTLLSP